MKNEILGIVLAILFGITVFPGCIWYIVNPGSAKRISKKLGGSGKDKNFHHSSDFSIRLAGIFLLLFGIFFEIGLLAGMGVI